MFVSREQHEMIDDMASSNENSGRELLVVNCWFVDENESTNMWESYGSLSEGVAVRSTIERLCRSVSIIKGHSWIGRVEYVDHDKYELSSYMAHQAHERAFLKDRRFRHEQELRMVTMNFRTQGCIGIDGIPLTSNQTSGPGMNNPGAPGVYRSVDLRSLCLEVVVSPRAENWFYELVNRIVQLAGINGPVRRSAQVITDEFEKSKGDERKNRSSPY